MARFWCHWLSAPRANQPALNPTLGDVNGGPAILLWEGDSLAVVVSLATGAAGIQEIYALLNPEKLAFLGAQLDPSHPDALFGG